MLGVCGKKENNMPKFNLMSYIMPPEDKMFFTLFQDSAEICKLSAKLYNEVLETKLTEEKKRNSFEVQEKRETFV